MEYKSIADGIKMPGLRLVLSMYVPGPWGEAAKSVFDAKGLPYIPVGQAMGEPNPELVAWAGVRNAPVAAYNNDKPVNRWLDIIMLAERIKPTPALLPADIEERALVIGITHEIAGEWGFGWCRRAMMVGTVPASPPGQETLPERMAQEYGCTKEVIAAAPKKVAAIMTMLTKRLTAQQAAGSPYLVGKSLTAADIYWACFSGMIQPMPKELNPAPDEITAIYLTSSPEVDAAKNPILITHRDFIYKTHLKLPLDF